MVGNDVVIDATFFVFKGNKLVDPFEKYLYTWVEGIGLVGFHNFSGFVRLLFGLVDVFGFNDMSSDTLETVLKLVVGSCDVTL